MFARRLILALLVALSTSQLALAEEVITDPIEPVNRGIFWFNDKVDVYFLEPVARGYEAILPDEVQEGIGNFFKNLGYPVYLVSDLVQGKITQAGNHTARFVINSTLGLAGFLDVAKRFNLEHHYEDFGLALAYHNVPSGPYIVIPFLGPSNLRDGFGQLVDGFLNPIYWINFTNASDDTKIGVTVGLRALSAINTRADLLDAVETAKESSLDYYLFVQSAYYQLRRRQLNDGELPEDDEDFDYDDDEEEE